MTSQSTPVRAHNYIPIEALIGLRYHRWTIISDSTKRGPLGQRYVNVRCDCGAVADKLLGTIRHGVSKSCGCLKLQRIVEHFTKHGECNTKEYHSWQNAKRRCYEQSNRKYALYGGRGIVMCERWRNDFAAFLADMGHRPSGRSLDRINNDGPYAPDNCRWATATEQANNRRTENIGRSLRRRAD